eukprot:UN05268
MYWLYKPNNVTCRGTLCMEYKWDEVLQYADMEYVEERDTLYYWGIVDMSIDDCYPDIDRKICWSFPFALELPRTVTVCTEEVSITGGDPQIDAWIVKLGEYIPEPYSLRVLVRILTIASNPWELIDQAKT